jgi:serine/threonine-protein kinase
MKVYERIQSQPPPLPSSVVASLDSRVDDVCLKALAKRPQDRYQSMAEFAEALDGYLS